MMSPVSGQERFSHIDFLRGVALFGVLLVNLMSSFRISLFDYIAGPHDTSLVSVVINRAVGELFEGRAFTLFSFLFGAGVAIQTERAAARSGRIIPLLARRFTVLFVIGLIHIALLWNGDILALYAVCGFCLLAVIAAPNRLLAVLGAVAIAAPHIFPLPIHWPSTEAMRAHAAEATRIYSHGGFVEIFRFRIDEARHWVLPLWAAIVPRTFGLMCLGVAAWRTGLLRDPVQHRHKLRVIFYTALLTALVSALLDLTPLRSLLPGALLELTGEIPLAFAYAAGILLWVKPVTLVTAVGRMALTNYLMQSVILSTLFYGFGLGLFGKLVPAPCVCIAIALYIAQGLASRMWLRHFRFGPVEWVWRSLTYLKIQPLSS